MGKVTAIEVLEGWNKMKLTARVKKKDELTFSKLINLKRKDEVKWTKILQDMQSTEGK